MIFTQLLMRMSLQSWVWTPPLGANGYADMMDAATEGCGILPALWNIVANYLTLRVVRSTFKKWIVRLNV